MLEGFDKDWIYTDATKRVATYTNLGAGTYIFKIKGSNNDGVWNETPVEIKVIIVCYLGMAVLHRAEIHHCCVDHRDGPK